jgi:hypothetical protein
VELKGPGYTSNYNNVMIIIPAIIIVSLMSKWIRSFIDPSETIVFVRLSWLSFGRQSQIEETFKRRKGSSQATEESRTSTVVSRQKQTEITLRLLRFDVLRFNKERKEKSASAPQSVN